MTTIPHGFHYSQDIREVKKNGRIFQTTQRTPKSDAKLRVPLIFLRPFLAATSAPRKNAAQHKLIRSRKVEENPKQRGGNRRQRIDDGRNRLRLLLRCRSWFILRFISSGTVRRNSRFGNRGSIRQTNWFGHVAPFPDGNSSQRGCGSNKRICNTNNKWLKVMYLFASRRTQQGMMPT